MTTLGVTWTGVDGSTWDLMNGSQGVALASLAGLHLPAFKQQTSQAARVPGQRYLGTVYNARDVVMAVRVEPTRQNDWRAVDRAFWASLSQEDTGTLTVTSDAGSRSLACRLSAADDPVLANDPAAFGVGTYSLTLEADQPFYTGADVAVDVTYQETGQNYYGGASGNGYGPPFYISPTQGAANASINNPGDRSAYTRLLIAGPGSVTFTIAGHQTVMPYLQAGQQVSIDTDPTKPNAVLDVTSGGSVDFWPFMGAHDFWVPVPAGSSVDVPIRFANAVQGQSAVHVTLTPLHSRAW